VTSQCSLAHLWRVWLSERLFLNSSYTLPPASQRTCLCSRLLPSSGNFVPPYRTSENEIKSLTNLQINWREVFLLASFVYTKTKRNKSLLSGLMNVTTNHKKHISKCYQITFYWQWFSWDLTILSLYIYFLQGAGTQTLWAGNGKSTETNMFHFILIYRSV
jgi:hypothetical protein